MQVAQTKPEPILIPAWCKTLLLMGLGAAFLTLLAQFSLRLPFSPVPVTGQTFGVAFLALTLGRNRAVSSVLAYLALGASGLGVFALHASGLYWGPTFGYLVGMVFAAALMGQLSDRGWTKSFGWSWAAAFLGSGVIFVCGLSVLAFFVPTHRLLQLGWLPFIPGDILKTAVAAELAVLANRYR